MFPEKIYQERRSKLSAILKDGIAYLPSNPESPVNTASNHYRYRQDSTFLYYFGIERAGLTGVIDAAANDAYLFGDDSSIHDIIWTGGQESVESLGKKSGVTKTFGNEQLVPFLAKASGLKRKVHYLAPYREDVANIMCSVLNITKEVLHQGASLDLVRAIVGQRSYKQAFEVEEIEDALDHVTSRMFSEAFKHIKPGVPEKEISGLIDGISLQFGNGPAFAPIVTIHGEILHNTSNSNTLAAGRLLLIDAGAESKMHYATDITRTYPVSGKFTNQQKEIYQCVLDAQLHAIERIKPGVAFKSVYLETAKALLKGLKNTGIVTGDVDEMAHEGTHALFFPHGLGHMMGLDVHDMENLGEDNVGYNDEVKRDKQFGVSHLRFGRRLEKDFVVTVEPGIYFIPALIEKWKKEKTDKGFVNYKALEKYLGFGGIRIEDDVLLTENGCRVLGKPIPKMVGEIEF